MNVKARFGTTVCSLVAAGLGIAIIDEFTVAHHVVRGLKTLKIEADSIFNTYIAYRETCRSPFMPSFFATRFAAKWTASAP